MALLLLQEPRCRLGNVAEHDIFIQQLRLKNTLRLLAGAEPLTHLAEDLENRPLHRA